jgi:hypothetical protein
LPSPDHDERLSSKTPKVSSLENTKRNLRKLNGAAPLPMFPRKNGEKIERMQTKPKCWN